jgi:pyruvate,water dikinase
MGAPQDIEWAITGKDLTDDEAVLFLQSRSITALTSNAAPSDVEWSRADFRESLPDLPSPQCASLLHRAQDQVNSFFNRLGFDVHKLGPCLKIIYGRPYLNLTLARRLLTQSGLSSDGVLWVTGHTELSGTSAPTCVIDWQQMWRIRRSIARLLLRGLRPKAEVDRFKRLADEIHRTLSITDWQQASPSSMLARFRLRTDLSSQMAETDCILSAAAAATYSVIAQVLSPLPNGVGQLVREAARTGKRASDLPQGRMLLELARVARADNRVRQYLTGTDVNFADYGHALAGTPFLAAFDEFLARYGQSATFEADPGWPRYGEDPTSLLATVARMTEAEALPDRREASVEEHRTEQMTGGDDMRDMQLQESQQPTGGSETLRPWHYWLANLAVKRLRRLAEMRAQLHNQYGQSMSFCRTWDLRLAERWVASGWLVEPGDYFWLTMEEVERALMAEAEVGPTIPALVRARREVYRTYAATDMPYAMRESDVTRLVPGHGLMETALSSVLSGLPVSPGQVQGRVVVLNRPEDADRMQEGVILVTPSTDTAWFPLFLKARGLIIETGGLLSHGSIITREFGLPAVANILNACNRFHDGDLVLLDGGTGLVQILDPLTPGSS